ncbi:MAG: methyl-accepting chemotaxis protein [Roseburia sp.]|nr:methyl-accepting chemotaxis protein [Roseburia sp.]
MKFKQKMFALYSFSMLVFGILLLSIGLFQFENGMYKETKNSLKSSALAAMNLYNSQGYGDYGLKADGNVWRGMNFNISEETSVVDDLKEQTGIDTTFFFGDTAVMTSILSDEGERWYGMKTGENITNYTLMQGAQLWYKKIEIDNKLCHAYIIPILQPGDGTVIGALMASVSTAEIDGIIRRYILISLIIALVILIFVGSFIYFYIGGLTKVLHDVRRVLAQVSGGEFSDERLVKINRKDEFGDLASSTEKLRVKIYDILNNLQHGTVKLTEAVERLNVTSENTTEAAFTMSEHVEKIKNTATRQKDGTGQASDDVDATKFAIDEMLKQIEGINQVSHEMMEMSKESAVILQDLEESSRQAQETMVGIRGQSDATNESVNQIRSITDYITNIAEETNLLALNASIEAARAGEAGKGFAVVAQQIQKLAEESNNSASQIGKNIQDLVEKTEGNLLAMSAIDDVLNSQREKVSRTKEIFDALNNSITSLTDQENNMQISISTMNQTKDNMSVVIKELEESSQANVGVAEETAEITGKMKQEINGMTSLTSDLTDLSENLNQNLKSFLS